MSSRRTSASLAALGAAGALLVGCSPAPRPRPTTTPVPSSTASPADAAVSAVQQARSSAEAAADAAVAAVTHVADQAQAAATGDSGRTGQVRSAEPVDEVATDQAVRALPARVTAYQAALDRLADALPNAHLQPAVTRALADVVAAGEDEADTLDRFATAAATAWSAFGALERVVDTWYHRARAGWYRNQQEAAGNFAVMTDSVRPQLGPAQQALAAANTARQQAVRRWSAAVNTLDAAQAAAASPTGSS